MHLNQAYNYLSSDEVFDTLFPINIRELSATHWTPLSVAQAAAQFLGPDEKAKIIDIGAGVGKFCIAGCFFSPAAFTGVELKKNFVQTGNKIITQLGLDRASLIQGNFMDLDLSKFTGIYFYNSFHENIVAPDQTEDPEGYSEDLFNIYTAAFHSRLMGMPSGTKLATYWLTITEIPGSYKLVGSHFNDLLKFWIKTS